MKGNRYYFCMNEPRRLHKVFGFGKFLDGTQQLGLPEHDVGLPLRLVTRNLNDRVIILNQSLFLLQSV